MHTEVIKIPKGQRLIKHDESIRGQTVALARVTQQLFAIYDVMPTGDVCDPIYAGTRIGGDQLFEGRLQGRC